MQAAAEAPALLWPLALWPAVSAQVSIHYCTVYPLFSGTCSSLLGLTVLKQNQY